MDIGESLVGAYLRHVEGCQVVTYNSFFADRQGEIDVVGRQGGSKPVVWLCEVTTHIRGMLLVRKGKNATDQVVRAKLERLRSFAELTYPGEQHRYEWWSPRVSVGALTNTLATIEQEWQLEGRKLEFVINEAYTERIRALAESARGNPSTTNEPAYRMLQILTHLKRSSFQI